MDLIIESLVLRYPALKPCFADIIKSVRTIVASIRVGGKLLVCGNGGSAADADHIVGELMKGFIKKRSLDRKEIELFEKAFPGEGPAIASNLQKAIPAMALTGQISLSTAFANDVNPDYVFAQQVYGLGGKEDVLICLSTSGNSRNIIAAAKVARAKGIKVISLTGENGGKLKELSDITIKAPSGQTHEVQEYHLPIYHALCAQVEELLFP
jgi:D-sedoheptulose 7-phosphate isomerase